jgi:hypothetical protein
MKKLVLVVCNVGRSSQLVAARLGAKLGEKYEFLARGALATKPSEKELEDAQLILTPFDENEFREKMEGDKGSEYYEGWMGFFSQNRDRRIISYGRIGFERLCEEVGKF